MAKGLEQLQEATDRNVELEKKCQSMEEMMHAVKDRAQRAELALRAREDVLGALGISSEESKDSESKQMSALRAEFIRQQEAHAVERQALEQSSS